MIGNQALLRWDGNPLPKKGPLLTPESDNIFLSVIAVIMGHDGMDDFFHKCSACNL